MTFESTNQNLQFQFLLKKELSSFEHLCKRKFHKNIFKCFFSFNKLLLNRFFSLQVIRTIHKSHNCFCAKARSKYTQTSQRKQNVFNKKRLRWENLTSTQAHKYKSQRTHRIFYAPLFKNATSKVCLLYKNIFISCSEVHLNNKPFRKTTLNW